MPSNDKVFSGLVYLPKGQASDNIIEGCIVLEGGAFRGVYGEGVLDAL
ncbi:MAG TPA: patatin family protein, partial [Erysipelotrichaceae bacterium]|nr:patatin family protein [Erysipelotrichaceae bacterium]